MRDLLLNLFLVVASVATGFFLCEMLVRIVSPQILYGYRDINRPDSVFIYRHRENANLVVNVGEGERHFVSDRFGYRVNYTSRDSPEQRADVTVLVIGDSFVEALAVENEETIPEYIARLLSENLGRSVEAVNAGHGGWCPNQYYLEARRSLTLRRFDMGLVFLYTGNDCIQEIDTCYTPTRYFTPPKLRLPRGFSKSEFKSSIYKPVVEYLGRRFHLAVFLDYQISLLLTKVGLIKRYQERFLNFRTFLREERDSERWDIVARICAGIRNEFQRHHVPVLFILIPPDFQVYEKIFYDDLQKYNFPLESADLEQPNKMLAVAFEKRSLPLIDLLDYLRLKATEEKRLYSSITRHLTARGNQIIAEYLLPFMAAELKENPW